PEAAALRPREARGGRPVPPGREPRGRGRRLRLRPGRPRRAPIPRMRDDPAPFAVRGRLVLDRDLVPGAVVVRSGRIVDVVRGPARELPTPVHEAAIVSPGFIDLQVNGGFGVEIGDSAQAILHLAARLPATGVTTLPPTLLSSSAEVYPRACQAFLASRGASGALPLGLHLAGPFISSRRLGAQR